MQTRTFVAAALLGLATFIPDLAVGIDLSEKNEKMNTETTDPFE